MSPTMSRFTERTSDAQVAFGVGQEGTGGLLIERVEGPLPAPLLAYQPRVLELLHVVGDLRLPHRKDLLELADADALIPLFDGNAGAGEVAATPALGHHEEHPHPYGFRQGAAQGDELLHPFLRGGPTDAVLLYDPESPAAHEALSAG